jgi:hypothetical protein
MEELSNPFLIKQKNLYQLKKYLFGLVILKPKFLPKRISPVFSATPTFRGEEISSILLLTWIIINSKNCKCPRQSLINFLLSFNIALSTLSAGKHLISFFLFKNKKKHLIPFFLLLLLLNTIHDDFILKAY